MNSPCCVPGMPVWPCGRRSNLPAALGEDRSARGVLGGIRRKLASLARELARDDLVELLAHRAEERAGRAKAVMGAIETLRTARAHGRPNPRSQTRWDAGLPHEQSEH